MPDKATTVLHKYFPDFFSIFRHAKILSCRSTRKQNKSDFFASFNSISSGAAYRTLSINASKEPPSSTSPGISSLCAIHTEASSSHVKLTTYSINYLKRLLKKCENNVLTQKYHTSNLIMTNREARQTSIIKALSQVFGRLTSFTIAHRLDLSISRGLHIPPPSTANSRIACWRRRIVME